MKRLPKFKSEEEEARFWDTHSPLDYPGEFTDVKEPFEFVPSLLRKIAKRRGARKHFKVFDKIKSKVPDVSCEEVEKDVHKAIQAIRKERK